MLHGVVGSAKPANRLDHDVDDPLYLMTLTIPQLFLTPMHMIETSMRAGNVDVYGFLEPQSIQRSRSDNYLKGIINRSILFFNTFSLALVGNISILIVQYASMFVLNNALKGLDDTSQSKSKAAAKWIVIKGNRQKGSTECGYYVMHWMSTIILGSFKNN
ncbi:hypothetical protein HKD37_17G047778 [Glycine soja]